MHWNARTPRPTAYRRYRDEVPLGRMGVPDDIAGAAIDLAADSASFIRGG